MPIVKCWLRTPGGVCVCRSVSLCLCVCLCVRVCEGTYVRACGVRRICSTQQQCVCVCQQHSTSERQASKHRRPLPVVGIRIPSLGCAADLTLGSRSARFSLTLASRLAKQIKTTLNKIKKTKRKKKQQQQTNKTNKNKTKKKSCCYQGMELDLKFS